MATEQSNLSKKVGRHSVFGIASVISGLLAFLFLLVDFVWFYLTLYTDPEGNIIPLFFYSPSWIISNLLCLILPILIGVVLGIIGLFQNKSKAFAIVGLILCLMMGILSFLSYIFLAAWAVVLTLSGGVNN